MTRHEEVDVVAFDAEDGGEGHRAETGEAIDADEGAHEGLVVIDVGEGEEAAEQQHVADAHDELVAYNLVAHRRFDFELHVFANHAETVEPRHLDGAHMADVFDLGYLAIDAVVLHPSVDEEEQDDEGERKEVGPGLEGAEATAEADGEVEEPGVLLIVEDAEVEKGSIDGDGDEQEEQAALDEGAPQEVPVAVEHEHEPPTEEESEIAGKSVELDYCQQAEGNEEEAPEEVGGAESDAQEEDIQQELLRDGQKLVGLGVLGWGFLHGESHGEVDDEEDEHGAIDAVERLVVAPIEGLGEEYAE